jgi:hypothetical protein
VNVCVEVHVGLIDWLMGGAASDRMNVEALPLTAVRPTVPVGFAGLALLVLTGTPPT